jgi:hypothetical protein
MSIKNHARAGPFKSEQIGASSRVNVQPNHIAPTCYRLSKTQCRRASISVNGVALRPLSRSLAGNPLSFMSLQVFTATPRKVLLFECFADVKTVYL